MCIFFPYDVEANEHSTLICPVNFYVDGHGGVSQVGQFWRTRYFGKEGTLKATISDQWIGQSYQVAD